MLVGTVAENTGTGFAINPVTSHGFTIRKGDLTSATVNVGSGVTEAVWVGQECVSVRCTGYELNP